ncbi:MAG: DUF1385 domain-containing protein [Candidatus Limnocylindrales bacterium]
MAPSFAYGGQALLEGVLMRGPEAIGVALRRPDGTITWAAERLDSPLHRHRLARAPFVRGVVLLYDTLVIGTRWLMRSGSVAAAGQGVELGGRAVALTLALTLAIAVGVFILLPLFLAQAGLQAAGSGDQPILQRLLEALIRVALFVGYLLVVSRTSEVQRVFQYHGAEHMTIHALEHQDPLTVASIRRYPTAHPRCGTEFLVVFIIVSIVVFSLVSTPNLIVALLARVVLIPVVAAISYELLRIGARYRQHVLVRWMFAPGIWLQRITTSQPDDGMIEVAVASLREALRANGQAAPVGSLDPPRVPLVLGAPLEPGAAT